MFMCLQEIATYLSEHEIPELESARSTQVPGCGRLCCHIPDWLSSPCLCSLRCTLAQHVVCVHLCVYARSGVWLERVQGLVGQEQKGQGLQVGL